MRDMALECKRDEERVSVDVFVCEGEKESKSQQTVYLSK